MRRLRPCRGPRRLPDRPRPMPAACRCRAVEGGSRNRLPRRYAGSPRQKPAGRGSPHPHRACHPMGGSAARQHVRGELGQCGVSRRGTTALARPPAEGAICRQRIGRCLRPRTRRTACNRHAPREPTDRIRHSDVPPTRHAGAGCRLRTGRPPCRMAQSDTRGLPGRIRRRRPAARRAPSACHLVPRRRRRSGPAACLDTDRRRKSRRRTAVHPGVRARPHHRSPTSAPPLSRSSGSAPAPARSAPTVPTSSRPTGAGSRIPGS